MDLFKPSAERLKFAKDVELWEIKRFLAGGFFHAFLGAQESVLVGAVEVKAVMDAVNDSDTVLVPDTGQTFLRQVTFTRLHHLIGHLSSYILCLLYTSPSPRD